MTENQSYLAFVLFDIKLWWICYVKGAGTWVWFMGWVKLGNSIGYRMRIRLIPSIGTNDSEHIGLVVLFLSSEE
jgi:hypothetical protein